MKADEKPYTLTRAGWPRPVHGGYPVPWVAPIENLGEVNSGRRDASAGGAICQVCGEDYPYGAEAIMFTELPEGWTPDQMTHGDPLPGHVADDDADRRDLYVPLDGAVLHPWCARLTAAMCPAVRDRLAGPGSASGRLQLIIVSVPANDADPFFIDGMAVPSYAPGECTFLTEIPNTRRPS